MKDSAGDRGYIPPLGSNPGPMGQGKWESFSGRQGEGGGWYLSADIERCIITFLHGVMRMKWHGSDLSCGGFDIRCGYGYKDEYTSFSDGHEI